MTERLVLELPEGWEVRHDIEPFALVGQPAERSRWAFVPSVSLQLVDQPAALDGVAAYAAERRRELTAVLADHLLIQVVESEVDATVDLLFAAAGPAGETTVLQRHRLIGSTQVLVTTATSADPDWPDLATPLTLAVRSARLAR